MKKKYVKPYIVVESFQLNAAVASSCKNSGKLPLNYGMDVCTLVEEEPGLNYFGAACIHDVNVSQGDGNDEICYHGPVHSATDFALKS